MTHVSIESGKGNSKVPKGMIEEIWYRLFDDIPFPKKPIFAYIVKQKNYLKIQLFNGSGDTDHQDFEKEHGEKWSNSILITSQAYLSTSEDNYTIIIRKIPDKKEMIESLIHELTHIYEKEIRTTIITPENDQQPILEVIRQYKQRKSLFFQAIYMNTKQYRVAFL